MYDPTCTGTPELTEEEKAEITALQLDPTPEIVEEDSVLGLVLGLTFGIPAIIGLAVGGFFGYKHLKEKYPEGWP